MTYHYPSRYKKYLLPGTKLVYYKGRQKKAAYSKTRLSPDPHYFAVAVAGESRPDPDSKKGDLFLEIHDFQPFFGPVLSKQAEGTIEQIPQRRATNYWRDGVRPISEECFSRIVHLAGLRSEIKLDDDAGLSFETKTEGQKQFVYTTKYERDPTLRKDAIIIHGTICYVCAMDMGKMYGELGNGFIHIHHKRPISLGGGPVKVDPKTDLVPLCPNCHSIVHRKKGVVLDVDELRKMIREQMRDRAPAGTVG